MKTEDILPKEKLKELYLNKKFSDKQIGDMHHISLGQVHRLRNKYKIRTIEQFERHHKQELNDYEKSLIVGLILGDGHLRKQKGKKTYPCLMLEQSDKHREYIYWLKEQLSDWLANPDKAIRTNRKYSKKTDKYYHSLSFQTVTHPVFEEFFQEFYSNGRKKLSLEILHKYFNELSLAVWIMDDGTLTGKSKRNSIATNNFTFDEVRCLQEFLKEKYGLKSWICRRGGKYHVSYELSFDKKSSVEIRNLVSNLVIPSMKYKLLHSETAKGTA